MARRWARHGLYPGEPNRRRLITSQLGGPRGEPFVQRPGALLAERSVELLSLFRQRFVQLLALLRECPFQLLTLRPECLFSVPAGCAAAEILRSQGAKQGEVVAFCCWTL